MIVGKVTLSWNAAGAALGLAVGMTDAVPFADGEATGAPVLVGSVVVVPVVVGRGTIVPLTHWAGEITSKFCATQPWGRTPLKTTSRTLPKRQYAAD